MLQLLWAASVAFLLGPPRSEVPACPVCGRRHYEALPRPRRAS